MSQSWPGLDDVLTVYLGAARYTVLGRTLQPLTIFHRELLRLGGTPLEGALTLPQLELATQICERPIFMTPAGCRRSQGVAGVLLTRTPTRLDRWRFMLRTLRWSRRLTEQSEHFNAYLESCCTVPEVMAGDSEPSAFPRNAPPLLDMLTVFAAEGIGAETGLGVWPAGLAEWIYTTLLSRTAPVKFLDSEDLAYQAALRVEKQQKEERQALMRREAPDRRRRILNAVR